LGNVQTSRGTVSSEFRKRIITPTEKEVLNKCPLNAKTMVCLAFEKNSLNWVLEKFGTKASYWDGMGSVEATNLIVKVT
jgi:hypothetical protein